MTAPPAGLEKTLGYRFKFPDRLFRALSHRSTGANNYERLEYLGDSVLGLVVAEYLYLRFPSAEEGELTRMRARIVRQETLAETAQSLALGDYLNLGSGEYRSGGHRRDSILSDTLEAIFGAIYLESDLSTVREIILRVMAPALDRVDPASLDKDPKTRLQERLQAQGLPLPVYELEQTLGKPHQREFVVNVTLADSSLSFSGRGSSRRRAEQAAARAALNTIEGEAASP